MESTENIDFVCDEVFTEELALCQPQDELRLWSKPGYAFINAYRPRAVGGQGLVFRLERSKNTKLATYLDQGVRLWMMVNKINATQYSIQIHKESAADIYESQRKAGEEEERRRTAPYLRKKDQTIFLDIPIENVLSIGQTLFVSDVSVNAYLVDDPRYRHLQLTDERGDPVAVIRSGAVVNILNTKYNGYEPSIKITLIQEKPFTTVHVQDSTDFHEVRHAEAVVSFPYKKRPLRMK